MKTTYTPTIVSNYLLPPKVNYRAAIGSILNGLLKKSMLAAGLLIVTVAKLFAQDGDTCATAINLQTLTSPYSSTTAGSAHNFTPSCNDSGTAPDLYFYIDLQPGYILNGETSSSYDAMTYIGRGGDCPGTTQLYCFDDDNRAITLENTTRTTQRIYWVQEGWGESAGAFTITWSLTPPPACNVPSNISAILLTPTVADISWESPVTGLATGYEYAVTENETPPATGTATTATSLAGVEVRLNHRAYVHVRSNCGAQGYSEWATYTFYSGICLPGSDWISGYGITNVTMGNINNATRDEGMPYVDFSDQVVNVGLGVTQPFSISIATGFDAHNVKIWIDWNNNLAFDQGEEVYNEITPSEDAVTITGTFTVPQNAVLGNLRLRIGAIPTWRGDLTPCHTDSGSVFEDYTINVVPTPTCYTPVNLATTNTGPGVISISWNAPAQGDTPPGYEYAVTATRNTPENGTPVTATAATGITVTTNVTGYLQVRTNCGNGDYSQWALIPFYNGVCIPAPTGVNENGITNVTMGTINNTTTREANQYGNFSAQVVNIGQGVTQQFSITISTSQEYDTRVWVDWNNDLDFDDQGEQVYSAVARQADFVTLNGTFTVPVTASLGNHRLRVGTTPTWADDPASPCYSTNWGTFEDYTVNVTPAPSCYAPTNTTAANVTTGLVNLSWTAPTLGGTPAGYEYAITTTPSAPATGIAVTATTVSNVSVTTEVNSYLHVRTNCGGGDYSQWVTIPFYNGICIPSSQDMEGNGIVNVTIGSINNSTGLEENNYGDFTAQVATVGQSVTQQFSITLNTDVSFDTRVWIDWNNDLDFEDEGEEVYNAQSREVETSTLRGGFTVPATAALGNHRLRVGAVRRYEAPATPCYTDHYGSYEDYTINVTTPPNCFMPDTPVAQNTAEGLVTVSWTAQTLGTTPTGYEYAVTTTATPPQSGTSVTVTQVAGVAATANTTNYLHVRTICGSGNYSEWLTVPFYNGHCIPEPTSVNSRGITNVTIGSINNSTPDRSIYYGDYTDQVLTVGQTVTQNFRISLEAAVPYDTRIWVDWNNDLDFDDDGEQIYRGLSADSEADVLRGSFVVPASAPLGNHRLRIGAVPYENGVATPCFTSISSFGNYEDYTINVTIPPTCFTPINPAGAGIASGNATLSWSAPLLGGAPTGYEYAVTTSQTPPASGTATTATTVNGYPDAEDSVYYYLHVRTHCGGGDYSQWATSDAFRYLAGSTCATAIDLATLISPYTSTTEGAENNFSPECNDNDAPELFYSIAVPNGYTVTLTLVNSDYDSFHTVFFGGCAEENQTVLECTDEDDGTTNWENLTGSTQIVHYVQDGWGPYSGEFTLEWELTPPAACDVPRNLDVNLTATTSGLASWIVPNTGSPAGYEYAVTTLATPPASGTSTTGTTATVALTPNTNSYLHVRSVCGEDGESLWVTYNFYSGYCVPESTESTEHYITAVSTAGAETNFTNTSTGFSAYTDYTAQHSVTTYPGGSFAIQASGSVTGNEYLYNVWVDWNNNLEYTDEGERVISSRRLASPAQVGSVIIPAGTPQGTYRMRIRNSFTDTFIPACDDLTSGEAEDYTIVVGPAPTCFPPYGLTITPVNDTTAELSWSPPVAGFPQGYEYVLGESPTAPTGSGTPTTEIYIYDVPFNPAQNAYLFVRSNCGDGDFSAWETIALLDTNAPKLTENSIVVYKEGSAIKITSGNTLMSGVTIYDIRGSKLYSQNNVNATEAVLTGLQIQQQVVIVEVATAKGKISKRIVF